MVDEEIKKMIFNDIYKVIEEIKKCHSKSRYNFLYNELDTLYILCDDIGLKEYPKLEDYSCKNLDLDFRKQNKNYFKLLIEDEEYNMAISHNKDLFDIDYYSNCHIFLSKEYHNMKNNLRNAAEFLKKYNVKIYDYLNKSVEQGRLLHFWDPEKRDIGGMIFPSNGMFNPYIVINRSETINDSVSIVHEFGHYYVLEKNRTKSNIAKKNISVSYFDEVYSHYISLIYLNYLKENKLSEYTSAEFKSINYSLYDSLEKISNIYNSKCESVNEIKLIIEYSYGILLAYHFYDMYLKDKELADYLINEFLKDDGLIKPVEMLEKHNLKEEIKDSKILRKYI